MNFPTNGAHREKPPSPGRRPYFVKALTSRRPQHGVGATTPCHGGKVGGSEGLDTLDR